MSRDFSVSRGSAGLPADFKNCLWSGGSGKGLVRLRSAAVLGMQFEELAGKQGLVQFVNLALEGVVHLGAPLKGPSGECLLNRHIMFAHGLLVLYFSMNMASRSAETCLASYSTCSKSWKLEFVVCNLRKKTSSQNSAFL